MTLTTFGLLIFNTGADIHLIFREILFLSGIFVILGTKFWNQQLHFLPNFEIFYIYIRYLFFKITYSLNLENKLKIFIIVGKLFILIINGCNIYNYKQVVSVYINTKKLKKLLFVCILCVFKLFKSLVETEIKIESRLYSIGYTKTTV